MNTSPFKTANASIYAPPRDWNIACALQNLRVGIPLTDAQKALVKREPAA